MQICDTMGLSAWARSVSSALLLITGTSGAVLAFGQNAPSDQGAQSAGELQEVVVTARYFSEKLQDTPVAVTALSAADLEKHRIYNVADTLGLVPNLYIQDSMSNYGPNQNSIIMRGIGLNTPLEPSAAVFLDGVYMPSNSWQTGFLDLQQVQVLRGPQGALFGRNTEAGAISLVTRDPQPTFSGGTTLDYGSFGTLMANSYVTGPIKDNLLFFLGGQVSQTDGYTKNIYTNTNIDGHRNSSARGALKWIAGDDLSVILRGDWEGYDGGIVPISGRVVGSPDPINQPGEWQVADAFDSTEISKNYGGSLTVNYQWSSLSLVSISAYRYEDYFYQTPDDAFISPNYGGGSTPNLMPVIFDNAEFPVPSGYSDLDITHGGQDLYSEELRLSSDDNSRFRWLAGLYLYNETNNLAFYRDLANANPIIANPVNFVDQQEDEYTTKGGAAFGQVSYDITKGLEATAGLRYSDDRGGQKAALSYNIDNFLAGSYQEAPKATFVAFTPQGSLKYRWNSGLMTYVSVGQGYKEGGFPLILPAAESANIPFKSETSTNYEVGAKTTWLDNRLFADLTLFDIEVKEVQVQTEIVSAGIPVPATTNAGAEQSKGVEFEAQGRPLDPLTLSTSWGYTDAEFTKYSPAPGVSDNGVKLNSIPEWTGSVSGTWVQRITTSKSLSFNASFRYIGQRLYGNGTVLVPYVQLAGYCVTDMDAALMTADNKWKVDIYVNNIFNAYGLYLKAINVFNGLNNPTEEPAYEIPATVPRAVGIRATYNF